MKTKIITVTMLLLVSLFSFSETPAQQATPKINLLHIPYQAQTLPYPGTAFTISVTLENTKNSQLVLKGYFVRDGKVIEQNLSDFSTDDKDRLVYSTKINAPLAEINYQFVLMDGQTPVSHSKRYSVRRPCMPDISSISAEIPGDLQAKDKVKLLQIQATSIQNEIQNYESAFKMLDELKTLTEK